MTEADTNVEDDSYSFSILKDLISQELPNGTSYWVPLEISIESREFLDIRIGETLTISVSLCADQTGKVSVCIEHENRQDHEPIGLPLLSKEYSLIPKKKKGERP